ncbi:hypothetical protein PR003_g22525 [Phytophthora rubi]|uniref:Uncharacterized protein n=1 Tax=Phytophthora rubi TaxID=129364 RepID=A0A6A3J035_9STRA|nr:hypothetical protein PR002_g21976 [Phytophthora rubi]KAE9301432.1 hypothetical protein PR003_g22525 [Phytophthora rubi]
MPPVLTTVGSATVQCLSATSAPSLLTALHRAIRSTTLITAVHPHPSPTRMGCAWIGHRRWRRRRSDFRAVVTESSRKKATSSLTHRAAAWATENPAFHKALKTLPWASIRKFVGLNAWGERLLYRLKLRGLNLFDRSASRQACPHNECKGAETSLTHVFGSAQPPRCCGTLSSRSGR